MSLSTNLVAGLSSGFDWRSMIDQLMKIEYGRVDLVTDRKTEYESKLNEWQSVNSMLLALKTATGALSTQSAFNVYTAGTTSDTSTSASDRLTVSTSSSVSPGMHQIRVDNLAHSHKLSSNSYAATDTVLSLTAGDILISGKVVNISATDTLADIKDKINAANTGSTPSNVTASIVKYGTNDYRLILTSDDTSADGISILNASTADTLGSLGFIETLSDSFEIKNSITGGAQSDLFTSSNSAIKDLLSLNTTQTSNLLKIRDVDGNWSNVIDASGETDIDLSRDSLTVIATAINADKGAATKLSASVVSETVDGTTCYRLQVDGIYATNPFLNDDNIFQTLGLIEGGVGDLVGDVGDNALTTNGQIITTSTLLTDIDGYLDHTAAPQDKIVFTGTTTAGVDLTAAPVTYNIDAADTVQDLLTEIESAYGDVTASINTDGKIQIVDNTTGTAGSSSLEVIFTPTIDKGQLDIGFSVGDTTISSIRKREVVAGEDASIVVDGVTVTDSSNTLTDVIGGVTLNLVGEDAVGEDTTITVKVERDLGSIKSKINDMADAFNKIMDYINTMFTFDDENEKIGGILFGDSTLSSVKSELINTVTQQITGLPSGYNYLSLIGISLNLTDTEEGKYDNISLSVDDDKLTDALETNFDDVRNLFIAYGSGSSPHLTYISHTSDTQGGTYDVEITQEATRATTTGSEAAVDLISDETLIIEDWDTGRVAEVSLKNGSDPDTVINAINSELAKEYTEKLVGDGTNAGVTSSSLFNAVGGSDDDVITFSGTRRNGINVSGSYTIEDAEAETVGDLLENIEDIFEDEITATLDGSGRIVITDTQAGDSQLTFTIDTLAIGALDFGTVDVDPTGADGSQEGRYAMTITASKTAGNELLLTHNTYGSGQRIIVSESDGTALKLSSPVYVWGKDVAGTINGITATGNAQTLSIDSDGNNADGLSISYTGTTTLSSATFNLTLGVAELLDRQLGFVTDSSDGYVAFKQTSLQNSIDSFETQIGQMEASLNRKMEMMINKFVAMEMAMSKIQSQSQWLAGQLEASYSGWTW